MTPSIRLHHDNVKAIIVCSQCEGTEFVESGHTFHKDSMIANYIFTCTGCGFSGTLDKMKLKTLSQEKD